MLRRVVYLSYWTLRVRSCLFAPIKQVTDYLHLLEDWKVRYAPKTTEDTLDDHFVEACQMHCHIEYMADVLTVGDLEERDVYKRQWLLIADSTDNFQIFFRKSKVAVILLGKLVDRIFGVMVQPRHCLLYTSGRIGSSIKIRPIASDSVKGSLSGWGLPKLMVCLLYTSRCV